MAESNQTNVLAAFEMLLEEIENEVELVNRAGGKAFAESDYERVQTAAAQGERLEEFRARVANMRREWRELMAEFDVEEGEDEEVAAQRRDLGRLERGVRTPAEAYRLPILRALQEMGGAGKTADVVDRVGEILKRELKDVDYQALPSNGQARWRNTTQWERSTMVKEGLLKDDSAYGVWEISEVGWEYLQEQAANVATSRDIGGLAKEQSNKARAPNWTEQEFELLAQNPTLSDEAIADKLPRRTADAVGWVRNGIHSYHTGKHYESILSKMMQRRLQEEPIIVCARCGENVR